MIGFVLGVALALAGPPEPAAAERAYRAGRFEEALELFLAASRDPGLSKGALYYDMGNCALRLNRPAEALFHYLRAEKRLPRDPEVEFNLRLAESRLRLDAAATTTPLGESMRTFADSLAPGAWLALSSGLLSIGLVGLVLSTRRPRAVRFAMAIVALVALLGAARLVRSELFPGPKEGVVLAREITLRAEASDGAAETGSLRAGERVRAHEIGPSWVLISHGETTSWTARDGIGIVD